MKRQYSSILLVVMVAAVFGVPQVHAGRRDPDVPIVITPTPGAITTHAEVPVSPNRRPFASPNFVPTSPIPPTPPGKK